MEPFNLSNFDDYWLLLSTRDSDIYFEIRKYLENPFPNDETSVSQIFRPSTYTFLEVNLIQTPYPTCQIVRYFPSSIFGRLFHDALQKYAKDPSMLLENHLKFFSLLTNVHLTDKWLQKCEKTILPTIFNLLDHHEDVLEAMTLCLLANQWTPLKESFRNFRAKQNAENPFNVHAQYTLAIEKKIHFLEYIFYDEFNDKIPPAISNCVYLVKTIVSIDNGACKNFDKFEKIRKIFCQNVIPNEMNESLKILCEEINRIFRLYNFIWKNRNITYDMECINLRDFSQHCNIIDILLEFGRGSLLQSMDNFELICDLLQKNQKSIEFIHESITSTKTTEINLYRQYHIINLLVETLLLNNSTRNYDEIVKLKCNEIEIVLESMNDTISFIEAIETILTTLFMRWEHIDGKSTSEHGKFDDSITTFDESGTSDSDITTRCWKSNLSHESKNGFICTLTVLKNILDVIHKSITNRLSVVELSDRLKKIASEIVDAKYRLNLLELYFSSNGKRIQLNKELKQSLTPFKKIYRTANRAAKTSSDDEMIESVDKKYGTVPKRRLRKKVARGANRKSDPEKRNVRGKKQSNESLTMKSDHFESNIDLRFVIGRMLAPATSFVAMCMSRLDLEEARRIVDTNNLENTPIGQELQFVENFNELKAQLKHFLLAKPAAVTKMDSDYSVEEIKDLVVHGFEASQILNILSTFINKNEIPESRETKILIERFVDNYPYLSLFTGNALQATTVIDYLLCVSGDTDIFFNIFNMVPKLCEKDAPFDRLHNQIGYYGCFKRLLQCLSLFNAAATANNESPITLQKMLALKCNVFEPNEIALNIKQEQTYKKLLKIDANSLKTIHHLKEIMTQFDVFNKKDGNLLSYILYYVINMNRLMNLRGKIDEDSITLEEILQVDLFSLIGEIIFDQNRTVSLVELEAITCNLNTNLIHVITKNTCPDIAICGKNTANIDKILSEAIYLLREVTKSSNATAHQLQRQKSKFNIENDDIIEYIEKHNPMVLFLMGEIHELKCDKVNANALKINRTYLDNLSKIKEAEIRRFCNNKSNAVATLSFDIFDVETLYNLINESQYSTALEFLLHCQEIHLKKYDGKISKIRDLLIERILDSSEYESPLRFEYIELISDLKLKARVLLENIERIDDHIVATRLIRTILFHPELKKKISIGQCNELQKYLSDIQLYANIANTMASDDRLVQQWTEIMSASRVSPELIFNDLMEFRAFDLCYQWLQIHSLSSQNVIKPLFVDRLLKAIAKPPFGQTEGFTKVCKSLLKIMIIQMDTALLSKVKNRELLQYLVDFLIEQSPNENQIYFNYKISLHIMKAIKTDEADTFLIILADPLLIIEQYIINSKFEMLTTILKEIRSKIAGRECKLCLMKKQIPDDIPSEYCRARSLQNHRTYTTNKGHSVSNDCIDLLLRAYAAKALEFHISEKSMSEVHSQTTETASLDSLCGTFVMPRIPPEKTCWIRDEDASYCMCCKRSVFTMLTRRHHCRRCGRVVCYLCSTKRMTVPQLYADVPVRVCDDCFKQTEDERSAAKFIKPSNDEIAGSPSVTLPDLTPATSHAEIDFWSYSFSGHAKHDNLLREEFCFEFAPSASLCLSILALHTPGKDCADFLLNFCEKFESLLRPLHPGQLNPEIDYSFVTRILYCLSLAAKVHGGNEEIAKIREHAEIINAVVQDGCESLLPMESINETSLRKLCDSLVVAEKWSLAIDLSLKCGFSKNGIMAAWGIACLKSGCFTTAREKFSHCLSRTTGDEDRKLLLSLLTMDEATVKKMSKHVILSTTSRPSKVQPLLHEIITVLEATCHPLHSDALQKASIISQSLASLRNRKKDNLSLHEPAVNILHTLSNLKHITQGKYAVKSNKMPFTRSVSLIENGNLQPSTSGNELLQMSSRFYAESLYYLISYGRHIDILRFLIKKQQIVKALKYVLIMKMPSEQFIHHIIWPHIRTGKLSIIVEHMMDMDETLVIWRDYIMKTCLMLEKKNLLNCLYHMQLLLKDTVRASMTCVKFYTMNCATYQELNSNSFHIINAQKHLQTELEITQWEEIKVINPKKSREECVSLVMKIDPKSINQHINTILMQLEATKFLAKCEDNGKEVIKLIPKISLLPCTRIPTLFGTSQDKIILSALILICGTNIEEGFGLAYRIIQDLNLNADKIYAIVTKYVAQNNQLNDVDKLVECIKGNDTQKDNKLCDEILSLAIQTAISVHGSHILPPVKSGIETLIRQISEPSVQIDCYILSGQLKSAYLLAVQYERKQDIRRILRHAEKNNQQQIKKLCEKKLTTY